MTDALSFLKGIAANPNDLTLHLVFADWLEERGDWRAEFLRLDATLHDKAETPNDAPAWIFTAIAASQNTHSVIATRELSRNQFDERCLAGSPGRDISDADHCCANSVRAKNSGAIESSTRADNRAIQAAKR